MIQWARSTSDAVADDDPWGEKAYAAALARRPKHSVRDHLEALHTSSKLTRWFRKNREPEVLDVTPENVIAALNRAGIRPVLLGSYGIGGYRSEARATEDVDVLVSKRDVPKALRVLEQEFPYLEIEDHAVVARFRNAATQKIVLDVMKPTSQAMHAVFRNTIAVGKTHRIPNLEMALVTKFTAMKGPTRTPEKKLIDGSDFTNIVRHNRAVIDLKKLKRLGDMVSPGKGAAILRLVAEIDAGRTIQV
jgi:hypothetical protein